MDLLVTDINGVDAGKYSYLTGPHHGR